MDSERIEEQRQRPSEIWWLGIESKVGDKMCAWIGKDGDRDGVFLGYKTDYRKEHPSSTRKDRLYPMRHFVLEGSKSIDDLRLIAWHVAHEMIQGDDWWSFGGWADSELDLKGAKK